MSIVIFRLWKRNLDSIVLTGVELDELLHGLRLQIGVFEHPQQVLEQDDLAGDVDGTVVVAGPLRELAEERVVDNVGADEVPSPRFPDVDRLEVGGGIVDLRSNRGARHGPAMLVVEGVQLLQNRLELREFVASFRHDWLQKKVVFVLGSGGREEEFVG
ncbi:hypothetical protein SLA2020_292550 [Shorea laevis]